MSCGVVEPEHAGAGASVEVGGARRYKRRHKSRHFVSLSSLQSLMSLLSQCAGFFAAGALRNATAVSMTSRAWQTSSGEAWNSSLQIL